MKIRNSLVSSFSAFAAAATLLFSASSASAGVSLGIVTVPDGGATALLVALGLGGVVLARRKMRK